MERFYLFWFFKYNRKVLNKKLIFSFSKVCVIFWLFFHLIFNILLVKLDFFIFSRGFHFDVRSFFIRFNSNILLFYSDTFLLSFSESKVNIFLLDILGLTFAYFKSSFKILKNDFSFLNFQILLDFPRDPKIISLKIFILRFLAFFKLLVKERSHNFST